MKVMIVGAGEVGYHIADRLSREGHDITMIEQDPEIERQLRNELNALVVRGSGASVETLEQADIEQVDMFIAVTDRDEVNLIACLLANDNKVPRVIARIKTWEYSSSEWQRNAARLGIDLIINPLTVVADEIWNSISYMSAAEVAEFAHGRVVFLGYPIQSNSPLSGISMATLGNIRGLYKMVVTAIMRDNKTIIPRGEDIVQEGDILYFCCNKGDLAPITALFGFEEFRARNVFILGADNVAFEIAQRLVKHKFVVKVVDPDIERCQRFAEQLEDVLVLNASGTDIEVLRGEGLDQADVFMAVTKDDKTNILCSLLAKRTGAKRAIALVDNHELVTLSPSLGVDVCISPRLATASAILKYVRRGDIVSVAMVEQSDAEVIEVQLHKQNPNLDKPLRELKIPTGSIIGAIVRGESAIVPDGDDVLESGDHVIIFSLPDAIIQVEEFFS